MIWNQESIDFLINNYPSRGKKWCMEKLGAKEWEIRHKAASLDLRIDKNSEFFKEFQQRAATSKVGKKRPDQSLVMKRLHDEGRFNKTKEQVEASTKRLVDWVKNNEHPRGMLGKKHSSQTREKQSSSGLIRSCSETVEVKQGKVTKMLKTKAEKGNYAPNRPHGSWKSGWREIGGQKCYFRSRWEANYARVLQFRLNCGDILKWEHEPDTFWFERAEEGSRSYLPDYKITNKDGSIEYHEVKGWMDDRSISKLKGMQEFHPDVKVVVIGRNEYKKIDRVMKKLLNGWEVDGGNYEISVRICSNMEAY